MNDININENEDFALIEKEAEEMVATHQITNDNATFKPTEGGFISLDFNGKHYERIQVIRLFPFTDANHYISIRTVESRSKEIGLITDLDDMKDDVKDMLNKQLMLHYFTPVITKIIDIKDEYGYAYFHVLTDKGECKFAINMGSNAVAKLSDTRIIISDLDENRFEIKDVTKLSAKEQRKLDLFL